MERKSTFPAIPQTAVSAEINVLPGVFVSPVRVPQAMVKHIVEEYPLIPPMTPQIAAGVLPGVVIKYVNPARAKNQVLSSVQVVHIVMG